MIVNNWSNCFYWLDIYYFSFPVEIFLIFEFSPEMVALRCHEWENVFRGPSNLVHQENDIVEILNFEWVPLQEEGGRGSKILAELGPRAVPILMKEVFNFWLLFY